MISDMVIRELIIWVAAVLSIYRISHAVAMEDGAFDIFSIIRNRFHQSNWISRGLHCVLCISAWLSAIPAFLIHWTVLDPILAWLSIAGACLIIHKKLYLH